MKTSRLTLFALLAFGLAGALEAQDQAYFSRANPQGMVDVTGTPTANKLCTWSDANTIQALGSLGTVNTLLHGNASGAPTFSAVDLASADVSNTLPGTRGGLGWVPGTPDSCVSSNVTGTLQAGSTDREGTCIFTGNGSSTNGVLTLDFSQTAPTGWRCTWTLESVASDGTWQPGSTIINATRTTLVVTAGWINTSVTGTNTALTNNAHYWATYHCEMF